VINNQCWTCKKETDVCPRCYGEFTKIDDCNVCENGYRCPDGDKNWEGVYFSNNPEISERVSAWIEVNLAGNPETLSREAIPFQRDEELDYLAFSTNYIGNREWALTDESSRRLRWLTHCRDLAIAAGGQEPRVMRMRPYADMMKDHRLY
jgi:hypothetical protein